MNFLKERKLNALGLNFFNRENRIPWLEWDKKCSKEIRVHKM
jgi:hypothetical protein